jgi:hypothetical protein
VPAQAPISESPTAPTGSAKRGWVYIGLIIVAAAAIVHQALSGSTSSIATSSAPSTSSASSHPATLEELTPPSDPSKPYAVKLKEIKVPGGKRSYDLELVYRKPPTLKDAYAAAAAEVAAWVRAHYDPASIVDIAGYVQIGDADKPDTWTQMKDAPKGWVFVWFESVPAGTDLDFEDEQR